MSDKDSFNIMPNNKNHLAIVIPAYKARFLRQALNSLVQQTDRRFRVYVGDDASPDNIKEICDDFRDRIDLIYTRFEENLGRNSLVAQWNRCIAESSENWIWLFCDDDVMEPKCVESFYKTIEHVQNQFNVLRFNTFTIDDKGQVTRINPPHPHTEAGLQFIYHRLKGERLSFVSEYIFSRNAYVENEGIIAFPLAWCSDDASWISFSKNGEILTIQGPKVHWRRGEFNISPPGAKYQMQRIEAAFKFILWLKKFIKTNGTGSQFITEDTFTRLLENWFLRQIRGVAPITLSNFSRIAGFINNITKVSRIRSYAMLMRINLKHRLFI